MLGQLQIVRRGPGPLVSEVPRLLGFNETPLQSDQFLGRADADEA
jgi:hypothetical protein